MVKEVIVLKGQRILFVLSVMLIAILCIVKMNMNYNRLSRYQYTEYMTEEQQQLVLDHLTDREIEYLTEWAISFEEYIDYIEEPNFSIYHVELYNRLKENYPYLTCEQIVFLIERSGWLDEENGMFSEEEVYALLNNYDYDTIVFWIKNQDLYNPDGILILSARNSDTIVTDQRGISTRVPDHLVTLNSVPVLDDEKTIEICEKVVEPLEKLCAAIVEDKVSSRSCGGLVVTEGYVSYEDQKEVYKAALEEYGAEVLRYAEYPGHSEHQLGLAIDFAVSGLKSSNFEMTAQFSWLKENAWKYGFILTYPEEDEELSGKAVRFSHWRFVGVEEAKALHEEGLSLFSYIALEEN